MEKKHQSEMKDNDQKLAVITFKEEESVIFETLCKIVFRSNQESLDEHYSIEALGATKDVKTIIQHGVLTKNWNEMLYKLDQLDLFDKENSPTWETMLFTFSLFGVNETKFKTQCDAK